MCRHIEPRAASPNTKQIKDKAWSRLDEAIKYLQEMIAKEPSPVPPARKYPDKSLKK